MPNPKVFIVDDHPVIIDALMQLLKESGKFEIHGSADSFENAMRQMESSPPDLAIVDIGLPGKNGIDLISELKHRLPTVRIMVFSMYDELSFAPKALRAGACGYLMKSEQPLRLLQGLQDIVEGKTFVNDTVKDLIFNHFVVNSLDARSLAGNASLTVQEKSIFRLIGMGYSSAQIADKLCISAKTVQTHKDNIRKKLNIGSSSELYRRAFMWLGEDSSPTE